MLHEQWRIVQVGAGRLAEDGHSTVTPHTSVILLGLGDVLWTGGRTWKQAHRAEKSAPGIVLSDYFLEKDLRKCHQMALGEGSFVAAVHQRRREGVDSVNTFDGGSDRT